jgi:hypothetical protein
MTFQQTLNALDILAEPANIDVVNYIKTFNGDGGFMYTRETDPIRITLKKKMETIIDDTPHSGASWGYMLRVVQAVLNGKYTYEQLVINKKIEDERYAEWRRLQEQSKLEDENYKKEELNIKEL